MVLVTHYTQSSCAAIPPRTSTWSKGIRLKQNTIRFQMISRIDRCISLKHAFPLRPASRCMREEAKGKSLQISSFKGNIQNDKAGDTSSRSILPNSSVKISFVPQDREQTLTESQSPSAEGTLAESLTAQDMPGSCASESSKAIPESQFSHGLFAKWLSLLHKGAPAEAGDDILEGPAQMDHLQEQKAANAQERGEVLKMVLCYFLGLDATIMVPLLIFIPLYLAVNVKYGAQVSRELTPLWIIGPLIVALYVKLLRGIFALYVFSFKQTVKVIKNLPTYYSIAHKYIAEGKLKENLQARVWQPVVNLKDLDYKELTMKKRKAFEEWVVEKYLDFVESIWPYYCRTIRFLKRANLI